MLRSDANAIPHQALIVATLADNVTEAHNGMFSSSPLIRLLTKYIGSVEANRFPSHVQSDRSLLNSIPPETHESNTRAGSA
jgi:hypothetical protein